MMQWDISKNWRYFIQRAKIQLMNLTEYRANTLSTILGSYGYSLMSIFFIKVLYINIPDIAGWSFHQMLVLFANSQLLFYIHYTLFGSIRYLSQHIIKGDLDKFLTKPLSAFFTVSIDDLNLVEMIPSFIIPIFIYIYALPNLEIFPGNYLISLASLIISLIIYFLVYQAIGLLSFWYSELTHVINWFDYLRDNMKYPADIFPKSIRMIIFTIIPIGIMAYAPTVFLLFGFHWHLFIYQLISLTLFIFLTRILWTSGLKIYSSASS